MESNHVRPRPEVIVDFRVDEGLLHVSLRNVGSTSAYRVRAVFEKPFTAFDGREVSTMRMFRDVPFLAPQKDLTQYVDVLARYAKRKQPMRIQVSVSYADRDGNRYQETMTHDLRMYLELGQARISKGASPDAQSDSQ